MVSDMARRPKRLRHQPELLIPKGEVELSDSSTGLGCAPLSPRKDAEDVAAPVAVNEVMTKKLPA